MGEAPCEYAAKGQARCPSWRCDCFIDTHPADPSGLHPEAFVVGLRHEFVGVDEEDAICSCGWAGPDYNAHRAK